MKKLFIIAVIVFFNFQFSKAYADTSCQPIYGGGQSCVTTNNIAINKTILNPETNKMVDNLGINDPKYQPDFITTFQIRVTNTSDRDFSSVQVKDIFPQYILYSAGPGTFDANTKTLTISLENLKVNESRLFTILGRVVDPNSIPLTNGNICVVNQALVTSNNNDVAQDNAQFCIEKLAITTQTSVTSTTKGSFPVLSPVPIKITPSTGPESLILFSLIPTGIAGWLLRKISYK